MKHRIWATKKNRFNTEYTEQMVSGGMYYNVMLHDNASLKAHNIYIYIIIYILYAIAYQNISHDVSMVNDQVLFRSCWHDLI